MPINDILPEDFDTEPLPCYLTADAVPWQVRVWEREQLRLIYGDLEPAERAGRVGSVL